MPEHEQRPRIAVVGTGWWATHHHIPGLLSYPGAELVALVDKDPTKLALASERFPDPAPFRSLEDLLNSSTEVDGIVVATQSAYHYEIARAALEAGKSVMVEKPMVFSAREAWELVDVANKQGLHLQVGYTYQFTRSARLLHEVVSGGGIGEIIHVSGLFASMVESYYRGKPQDYQPVFHFPLFGPGELTYSDPAIAGGGHGQTQLTHAAGMIFWVTDLSADEVMAYMERRDLAVDLVDAIAWRFQNGAVGCLGGTGNIRPGEPQQQELRYYGTEGFALQDLVTARAEVHYADGRVEVAAPDDPADTYPAEATARGFADLIAGRGPNLAPGELGARAVELLEAAYRAAERGAPVRVSELSRTLGLGRGG